MAAPARVRTTAYSQLFTKEESDSMYEYLRTQIQWEEGIQSKGRHTRFAKALSFGDNERVDEFLARAFSLVKMPDRIQHLGIYLNYYPDGTHYTPSHSHPKQVQLVIRLGAPRTLKVGTKNYALNGGDAIVFGSSAHEVPVEKEVKGGCISIATFSLCLDKVESGLEKQLSALKL